MENLNKENIRHFRDIEFTVRAAVHDGYVEYQVYEINGYAGIDENSIPYWPRTGFKSGHDLTDKLDEAELYLHGSVKWDGCSNWSFDEQDRGVMLHGCSRRRLLAHGEIMARCWDWTRTLLPDFDAGPELDDDYVTLCPLCDAVTDCRVSGIQGDTINLVCDAGHTFTET